MRGGIWASVFVCAGTALWSACAAEAGSKAKPQITIETVKQAIEGKTGTVQLVHLSRHRVGCGEDRARRFAGAR